MTNVVLLQTRRVQGIEYFVTKQESDGEAKHNENDNERQSSLPAQNQAQQNNELQR